MNSGTLDLLQKAKSQSYSQEPNSLWEMCTTVSQIPPEHFDSVSSGEHTINIPKCVPPIRKIIDLYKRIDRSDLDALSDPFRQGILNHTARVINELCQIAELQSQYRNSPNDAVINMQNLYSDCTRELHFVALGHSDVAKYQNRVDEVTRRCEEALERASQYEEDARKACKATQDYAAEAGVLKYAQMFADASKDYGESKTKWMRVFIGVTVATLVAAIVWFFAGPVISSETDPATVIQQVSGKLIVFAILSYGIVWTSRNYRAAAHNEVVNDYRSNALKSFESFVEASSSTDTRDAVLIQATQCIFSHRPSGFGQDNDAPISSPLLELTQRGIQGND